MRWYVLMSAIVVSLLPSLASAAVTYERSPSGSSITNPVSITVQADNFSDFGACGVSQDPAFWAILVDSDSETVWDGVAHPSTSLSATSNLSLSLGDYTTVAVVIGETEDLLNQACASTLLEYNNDNVIFTVAAAAAGRLGGTGGFLAHTPIVKLLDKFTGQKFSGMVPIRYEATDEDELDFPKNGLRKELGPVNIYYGHRKPSLESFYLWEQIAIAQPATGTFLWDTTKILDGNLNRLRITVQGADGEFSDISTEDFTLDNTPPKFTVDAEPSFSRGEPVTIKISSSEFLSSIPSLTVAQLNHDPIDVSLTDEGNRLDFNGTYKIIENFDGPASIAIEGEDLSGNKSTSIVGDENFSVGTKPPPSPIVKVPQNNSQAASSIIAISGIGLNAKKITLKVNGSEEYTKNNLSNGVFSFDNVQLDPQFNKGKNTITVVSYDPAGNISPPTTLEIFINSAPKVSILEPSRRQLTLKGEVPIRWSANDVNDDTLTYSVELSDDRGATWEQLAKNLKEQSFNWNSNSVSDSSNYLIRVVASDGLLTSTATSFRLTISNDLPVITMEKSGELFVTENSGVFKGIVRGKKDLLTLLEFSSDNGQIWQEVLPEDGAWNSVFERFEFAVPFQEIGSYNISLRGITASGLTVANDERIKVLFDNEAPDIMVDSQPTDIVNTPLFTAAGSAEDSFSGIEKIEYAIDDSVWYLGTIQSGLREKRASFKIEHVNPLDDGEHRIKVRAFDQAGNVSTENSQNILIDATPPRIGSFTLRLNNELIFPGEDGYFRVAPQTTLSIRFAIAGDPKQVKLFANGNELKIAKYNKVTNAWEGTFSVTEEDFTVLEIKAVDDANNKTEKELLRILTTTEQTHEETMSTSNGFIGKVFAMLKKITNLFDK